MQFELGKVPPQSIELEEAILGGIMLEKDAVIEIIDILKAESFYKEEHQKIYSAILDLFGNDKAIDILTVTEKLRQTKELDFVGGPAYLTQLTSRVASAAHIEFHARIVQQKYIQRELIRVSSEIHQKAFDDSVDIDDSLDYAESQIFSIANQNVNNEPVHIGNVGTNVLNELEIVSKSDKSVVGLLTAINVFDKHTNGLLSPDLIILAARPSMGKTTLALQIAVNISTIYKNAVAYFSYEMSKSQLYKKANSSITGISSEKYTNATFTPQEWEEVERAQAILESSPLYLDDTSNMSILELRAKARRLKSKYDIKLIIIDYLQLMSGSSKGNREQEISNISRGLKIMAKELDIPVIALSQLNRSVENRPDKKPQLSDLRESGAIEQDADIVAFLYRPFYYGFTEFENQESTIGVIELLIRKFRNGKVGDLRLRHDRDFTKVYDPVDTIEEKEYLDDDLGANLEF